MMSPFERIMAEFAIEEGWFRFTWINFTLPSGRKFRYQMEDYPFRVFASEAELDALCCQIIKDKYRYCEWDREHPKTNSEAEIFDTIKKWMMNEVNIARKVQAEMETTRPVKPDDAVPRSILELASRPDFPENALGLSLSFNDLVGEVVDVLEGGGKFKFRVYATGELKTFVTSFIVQKAKQPACASSLPNRG